MYNPTTKFNGSCHYQYKVRSQSVFKMSVQSFKSFDLKVLLFITLQKKEQNYCV